MAIIQDTFNETPDKGFPGMVVNGETSNRFSRTCEDAAGIAFGAAVFRGAGDRGCTATPAADAFLGFAMANSGIQPLPGGVAADIYPQYESVGILGLGCIFVTAGVAVDDGDPVYVTPAGVITNADGGGANFAATGFVFDETIGAAGLVAVARR